MPTLEDLVDDVRFFRLLHGLNQSKLARMVGISPQAMNLILRGKTKPAGATVLSMLKLLTSSHPA